MNRLLAAILIITGLISPVSADVFTVYKNPKSRDHIYFNYSKVKDQVPTYDTKELLCLVDILAHHNGRMASVYAVTAPFASTDLYYLDDMNAKDCTEFLIKYKYLFDDPTKWTYPSTWDLAFLNGSRTDHKAHGKDGPNSSKPLMDYLYKKSFTGAVR